MRIDQQVQKIEEEIKEIKSSFEHNANSMQVYTSKLVFTTSKNVTNWSNSGAYSPLEWEPLISMFGESNGDKFDHETIELTFDCAYGINTFANLEMRFVSVSSGFVVATTRRVPYSGGARWLIIVQPKATSDSLGYYTWYPSTIEFAVQSAAQGTLRAKMLWQ